MGKFDNILIISDIDDTFLTKHEKRVPQRNLDAIEHFKREGGRFTFATGRIHNTVFVSIPNADKIANAPGIMANGAYFYNYGDGTTFNDKFIDPDDAYEVTKFIYEYSDSIGIRFSRTCGTVYARIPPAAYGKYETAMYGGYSAEEPYKWNMEGCYKIVMRGMSEELDALRADVEAKFGDKFDYIKSGASFFEIQPPHCSKGIAVTELLEHYKKQGIDITAYACGDYENDISMLRAAHVAVCPENASDDVKAICDLELCHCNYGVIADLIEIIEMELDFKNIHKG